VYYQHSSYTKIQNTAATGEKINSIPAETRTDMNMVHYILEGEIKLPTSKD